MKIPPAIRDQIVELVALRADAHSYMSRSRTENREFIQQLTLDPEVGGRLADFMPKERVRTYIKDSILNAYAKKKNYGRIRPNYIDILSEYFSEEISQIETAGGSLTPLIVARGKASGFVVAKVGSVLKWETAVRHIAEYLVKTNNLGGQAEVAKVVILQGDHFSMNSAQKAALGAAASVLGIRSILV
jgi:hypothetical protein